MSKLTVCYKWVRDEADVRVNADLSVDIERAKFKLSDYDKNTIEAGSKLAKALGCESVGLSCGGAEARKSFADALARGLDSGLWVNTGERECAASETAALLAAAVRSQGDVSAVLCSDGSSDEYARQTGPRLAALLGWPVIGSVVAVETDGETLTLKRKLEDRLQTVRADLPCVVVVLPEVGPAPIPGLKQVMTAKKKPVLETTPEALDVPCGSGVQRLSVKGYVSSRKNILISEGSDEANVKALVAAMRREGVI